MTATRRAHAAAVDRIAELAGAEQLARFGRPRPPHPDRDTDRWRRVRAACCEHTGLDDLDAHADRVLDFLQTTTPGGGSTVEGSSAATGRRR